MRKLIQNIVATLVTLSVASCTSIPTAVLIAPFEDRPGEAYLFQHEVRVIDGTVWTYTREGGDPFEGIDPGFDPVSGNLGFVPPRGFVLDRNTYVVTIDAWLFQLDSQSDYDAAPQAIVAGLIAAAEVYCAETGYIRQGDRARFHVMGEQTHLVEFCVPPGVTLPPANRAGDRVPR